VLFDLGVSSHQIDEPTRGFSFDYDGDLDMRMDRSSDLKATDVVNSLSINEIADILYYYGDVSRSRVIANEIITRRPIYTTAELKEAITCRIGKAIHQKTLAQCFQAIRIYVNKEMESLEQALNNIAQYVSIGGRLVVLSYHSLEDRRVKQLLKFGTSSYEVQSPLQHTSEQNSLVKDRPWKALFKTPMIPSDDEIKINRRARSAKLRVGERI
jgi:16S rRNA (cytosine1402-N4)-methyltransferase